MPSFTDRQTFLLPANERLVVTADAGSTGTLTEYTTAGVLDTPTSILASTTTRVGPFAVSKKYEMISDTGLLTRSNALAIYDDQNVLTRDVMTTTSGIGAKNGATVAAVENGNAALHKTTLTCTATTITISDDAGVAQYGGVKLYDFPEGLMCIHGAVVDGSLTAGVTGTIIATFDGDVAVGTATASTGATLIGTEADIMPSVALTTASGTVANSDAVSVATALTESGARWHDGTATAKDLYLNYVIDDDASHTAGTATFTGTVTFIWSNLGDK